MKKIYVITQGKDAYRCVDKLAELGVVHVDHAQTPKGSDLEQLRYQTELLNSVLAILKSQNVPASTSSAMITAESWEEEAETIVRISDEMAQMEEEIAKRRRALEYWKAWGDFDPRDINFLADHGVRVSLFEGSAADLSSVPAGCSAHLIAQRDKKALFAVVSAGPRELPFDEVDLPELSLSAMIAQSQEDSRFLERSRARIQESAANIPFFEKILKDKTYELNFQEAVSGMAHRATLVYLQGFCPLPQLATLQKAAEREHWVVLAEDPSAEDKVPTLMKNPKWVELIKPVFGVINVYPGYREVDISVIFLIFFSIFFGILIGDAGYGIVIAGLTLFAKFKTQKTIKDQTPFLLMFILCACTVVWGVLTGTFFGTKLFASVVKPVLPWLTETSNVQSLCFLVGAVHLSIARGWRILMKFPNFFGMAAELGWMIIIWGAFLLANVMVVGAPLAGFDQGKSLLVVGVGAAFVAADLIKRWREGIFVSLVLAFFSVIGAFTDVVSYIRLFAVGLAGVAVADAFNVMALGVGFSNWGYGIITILILLAGHLFNIVLCGFAILVHGLRLNVLEFSGHLGLEWAGFQYKPLKKHQLS